MYSYIYLQSFITMENGKFLFFSILALMCGYTGIRAQVTIGSFANPKATLDIIGDTATVKGKAFRLVDGNQGVGRFLVSDANGVGTWIQTDIHFFTIQTQPQPFTFYENPYNGAPAGVVGGNTIQPLTVSATSSDPSPILYEWRKITSKNLHVPLSEPCSAGDGAGYNTASFTPNSVKKGDTRNANYTGMYRYFCRMTDGTGAVIDSDIAEVAVGCGAKNLYGEWVSFMCFNLGADNNSTLASQRNYTLTGTPNDMASGGLHFHIQGEENLYGDLFQWGRIADGHEKRLSPQLAANQIQTQHIGSGRYCSTSDVQQRPWNQVLETYTAGYGRFILSNATTSNNWHPSSDAGIIDMLWRPTGYFINDPCAHYQVNGIYHPFWNDEGLGLQAGGPACGRANTAWRTPSQDEWASIYKGGLIAGRPENALANSWKWREQNNSDPTNFAKGFGVTPTSDVDNLAVETLFLPSVGSRSAGSGNLYNAGTNGGYWSSSLYGTGASYYLSFYNTNVDPARQYYRGNGFALRCIRE
jgi:hypothetical protein